ncbi:MAG: hypothetical protein GTO02_12675 [Candidatus Dadabacteria bacterium]|nr:hypothetical protein [Candidatus Dadabacteria bacterium]NIQ15205.1 hypothetical protein [Candidatus Dadabacteria bacterium]
MRQSYCQTLWEVPIVITSTSGFPEIEKEKAGYVVTPTSEGITKGIERILNDTDGYNAICKNARTMVLRNYLWDKVGEKMENALLSMI